MDFLLPGTGLAGSLGWLKRILDLINLSHRTLEGSCSIKLKDLTPTSRKMIYILDLRHLLT